MMRHYPNYIVAQEDFPKIFSGDALTVPLTLLLDETGAVVEALSGWSAETPRPDRSHARDERPLAGASQVLPLTTEDSLL